MKWLLYNVNLEFSLPPLQCAIPREQPLSTIPDTTPLYFIILQRKDTENMSKGSEDHWEQAILSHEIQTLLTNNNDPSKSAVLEIRKFLRGPREELDSLNASIQDLETRLETLKAQRSKVQDTITRYSTILSPIRRVPTDVLSEIFFHCLPMHRNPFLKSDDCPVLLTRICSRWRTVALSTPRLWARIHITFTDDDRLMDNIPPHLLGYRQSHPGEYTVAEVTKILQQRCNAVKGWLARSGKCPLFISLHYTCQPFRWGVLRNEIMGDITIQLLHILSEFSHRWCALDLTIPAEVLQEFIKILIPSDLSMLTSLKLSLSGRITSGFEIPVDALNIQNLKQFTVAGILPEIIQLRHLDLDITLRWTTLTDFFSYEPLLLSQILTVFDNCPNIIRAVVMNEQDPWGQAEHYQLQVHLPNLRNLCIIDNLNPWDFGNFYDCIDAPNLDWVDYRNRTGAYSGRVANDELPPIAALLRRSTGLKRLTLNAGGMTAEKIRHIFESATNVTHLMMGTEWRPRKNVLQRSTSRTSRKYYSNLIDLGVVDEAEGMSASGEDSNKPATTLLPHLEVLEVSDGTLVHIPDEVLLQFILGRMDPSSPRGLAVLKKVHIYFSRLKEKDIVKDVHRQAELLGTHIDLNLDYIQEDDEAVQAQYEALSIDPGYGSPFYDSSSHFWDHGIMNKEVI